MSTADGDDHHQDERHRRGQRVVVLPQELVLDRVADHRGVRAAEELRVDEVTGGGDEHEQACRRTRRAATAGTTILRNARAGRRVEVLRGVDEAESIFSRLT